MIRSSFPSRDTLNAMSLDRLRLVDVVDKDEELLIQEIVDAKTSKIPAMQEVYIGDVPDIKTPEQEKEWQAVLDKRAAKIKARGVSTAKPVQVKEPEKVTVAPAPVVPLEAKEPEPKQVVKPTVVVEKKFCDKCDSKGNFHKKGCPNKTK
jgi:hypothetical protein